MSEIPENATTRDLAELLERSPRRVRQIADEAGIRSAARDAWPVAPIVRAALRSAASARPDPEGAARGRALNARAREIELRTAREERELIPTDESVAAMQQLVGLIVGLLIGLPAQITRDLGERRRIEALVDQIRTKVADQLDELAEAYRRAPPEVGDAADDAPKGRTS